MEEGHITPQWRPTMQEWHAIISSGKISLVRATMNHYYTGTMQLIKTILNRMGTIMWKTINCALTTKLSDHWAIVIVVYENFVILCNPCLETKAVLHNFSPKLTYIMLSNWHFYEKSSVLLNVKCWVWSPWFASKYNFCSRNFFLMILFLKEPSICVF